MQKKTPDKKTKSSIVLSYPFAGDFPVTFRFGQKAIDPALQEKFSQWAIVGHNGIDFATPEGTQILAADKGKVVQVGQQGDFGITITISHSWGTSLYAHLSQVRVTLHQTVSQHEMIGLSGKSGITQQAHLHFGMRPIIIHRQNGYLGYIDPQPYLVHIQKKPRAKVRSLR